MRPKIMWHCPECGFNLENNIELIMEHGEPVCICGEYMIIDVELE